MIAKKYHVKKGDAVVVNSGKWKGENAKILAVLKKKDRVVLELAELTPKKEKKIGLRTMKKTSDKAPSGLVQRSVSVHVSNVAKKD